MKSEAYTRKRHGVGRFGRLTGDRKADEPFIDSVVSSVSKHGSRNLFLIQVTLVVQYGEVQAIVRPSDAF